MGRLIVHLKLESPFSAKEEHLHSGERKKSGTAGSPPNYPGALPWFSSLQWVENQDSLVCEHGADINQSIPDSNYSDCPETERSLVWSQLCQQSCAHKSETRPLRIQIRALQEQIYCVMRSEMLFPCFMFILAFIFSTPIIFSLQKNEKKKNLATESSSPDRIIYVPVREVWKHTTIRWCLHNKTRITFN